RVTANPGPYDSEEIVRRFRIADRVAERALGNAPHVSLLPADRWTDTWNHTIEAGGAVAVPDVEIQPAVRRHERPLVGDEDVADKGGRHPDREPGDKQRGDADTPQHDDRHERDAEH